MSNFTINADEVILYEGDVSIKEDKGRFQLTLTSQRIFIEQEKGVFKKTLELIYEILLTDIKIYNDEIQIHQKSGNVSIQTINKNIEIIFSGMIEARKFTGKVINAISGTTLAKRSSNKIKGAFDLVDDTFGLDTRGAIRGVMENGIKGTIINGISKKK